MWQAGGGGPWAGVGSACGPAATRRGVRWGDLGSALSPFQVDVHLGLDHPLSSLTS